MYLYPQSHVASPYFVEKRSCWLASADDLKLKAVWSAEIIGAMAPRGATYF